MAEGGLDEFGAWYCGNRPQFSEQGFRNFCPPEGCPKGFCAMDAGWKHGEEAPPQCRGVVSPPPTEAVVEMASGEGEGHSAVRSGKED